MGHYYNTVRSLGRWCCLYALWLLLLVTASAQQQQRFHRQLPAGNYSGIAALGHDRYAVVSDKSAEDGFFVFRLVVDSAGQRITEAENLGFRSSGLPNRDMEAICYRPSTNTIFIAGEQDNEVYEYQLDGQRTGRRLLMPEVFKQAGGNLGLESLTYDEHRHLFITTTERPLKDDSLLRFQTFDDQLQPRQQYLYRPDAPISRKYYHGVSELCALGDGRLLVLERQIRVPRLKIGAKAVVRIYATTPYDSSTTLPLRKTLVAEYTTRLTLTGRRFANYEALCLVRPGLLLLMADSQNQFKGVLRDWLQLCPILLEGRGERGEVRM